jgi:hypothetical protein
MTEVHAGFQQLLHRYDRHFIFSFCLFLHPDHPASPVPVGTRGLAIPGCVVLMSWENPMPNHYNGSVPVLQVLFSQILDYFS